MRYAIVLLPLLALLAALACNGSSEQAQPTPTPSPAARSSVTPEPTPTLEPSVETLAFIRDGDIWLINADGSEERQLTHLGNVQWFSWVSPSELDVADGADSLSHLLVDVSGEVTEIPFPAASSLDAGFTTVRARGAWSPDGTRYVVPVDQQLAIFDRSGAEVARLQAGPPIVENSDKTRGECGLSVGGEPDRLIFGPPAFSSDGQRILVAVNCLSASGAYQLYSSVYEVSLDGSVNRPLGEFSTNFRLAEEFLAPRSSPDGAYIAQMGMGGSSLCPVMRGLAVAQANGSDAHTMAPSDLAELQGDLFGGVIDYDWSPTSDAVVASFDVSICQAAEPFLQPAFTGLYILKLEGSGEERLLGGQVSSVAWSPSGRFIAFVSGKYFGEPTEPPALRLLDLRTREVRDLGTGGQPSWQPQP